MNDIQVGRYSAILHKLLGITEGAPAPTLAPEIISTLALEVDRPEWAFLAGERLCFGGGVDNAVAGEVCHVQLFNPSGSDALIVCEQMFIRPATNGYCTIGNAPLFSGAGTAALASGYRDRRLPAGAATCVGECWSKTQVGSAQVDIIDSHWCQTSNSEVFYPQVLPPGFGITVGGPAVNTALAVSFVWRERYFDPQETR